jgi:adenylate cyclase
MSANDVEVMWRAVSRAFEAISFEPLVEGIAEALSNHGVLVDRINLPMNKVNGFHHPVYANWNVTWERGQGTTSDFQTHDAVATASGRFDLQHILRDNPYFAISFENQKSSRFHLAEVKPRFGLLRNLKDQGYTDYLAFGLKLPNNTTQPLSFATKAKDGFGESLEEALLEMEDIVGLALFNLYQAALAFSVATAYIGHHTGIKVLTGDITRGAPNAIDAGILFCDVRGFTAMSERFATSDVVICMNRIFDCVGAAVASRKGEILKFIGDAMLVVFRRKKFESDAMMARQMVEAVKEALETVHDLRFELPLEVAVGFGAHMGEVIYGNIGTAHRLDFTIMGPAVNLTARLESLTKEIGASLAVSKDLAVFVPELTSFGDHQLKGIADPVSVWGLPAGGGAPDSSVDVQG